MQALTVAVSPSGINYFAQNVISNVLINALKDLTVPDRSITVPDFWVPVTDDQPIGYSNVSIKLSGGRFTSFNPTFKSITQQTGQSGMFALVLTASNVGASYNWDESFVESHYGHSNGYNRRYEYDLILGTFDITVMFQLSYQPGNNDAPGTWGLLITSTTSAVSNTSAQVPKRSVLNGQKNSCFSSHVDDATASSLKQIQFDTAISTLLQPLFKTIADSGNLVIVGKAGKSVTINYDFGTGPDGLKFPNNNGIAIGVIGQISYNNEPYQGQAAPVIPVPVMQTAKHLVYNASTYEFNGLFWAFYQSGFLNTTITTNDVPDKAILNTNYYKSSSMQNLYKKYPNRVMTIDISPLQPPTVAFQWVYNLTQEALDTIKGQLTDTAYNSLVAGMLNVCFLDKDTFDSSLEGVLSNDDFAQYTTIIEKAACLLGTVVSHNNKCTLNVIDQGASIPVIDFSVAQSDFMNNFMLGIASANNTIQTLQFSFQIISGTENTSLIHSIIEGIDATDFNFVWSSTLEPVYATTVNQMGQNGVPLPRIQNFSFLFTGAVITINDGYVNVATDLVMNP